MDELRQMAGQRFEFDSMINLRPSFGNRGVDAPAIREAITTLVHRLVRR